MASVALRPNFSSTSMKRQKPTRIPYSCQAQLGRSGSSGWPCGGESTMRGMARSIDHSSTLTMVHTATRASFGSLRGGRSTIAEYATRSLGSFMCGQIYRRNEKNVGTRGAGSSACVEPLLAQTGAISAGASYRAFRSSRGPDRAVLRLRLLVQHGGEDQKVDGGHRRLAAHPGPENRLGHAQPLRHLHSPK